MAVTLIKEKVCVEDIELSMDTVVEQNRGPMTPFNAAFLPYDATQSVEGALLARPTAVEGALIYANINGDLSQPFKVYGGINPDEAMNVAQIDDLMANTIALKNEVLLLNNDTPYNPAANYNPATKLYADTVVSDRFQGVVSGSFTSADGKTITVTGGLITAIV